MSGYRKSAPKADAIKMERARRFLRDHKPQNCNNLETFRNWQEEVRRMLTDNESLTESMTARLTLFADDLNWRRKTQELRWAKKIYEDACAEDHAYGVDVDNAEKSLLMALTAAIDKAPQGSGFLYFKRWTMPDGSAWYKVGITNDPNRRDAEQNVLPVAADTLACIDVGGMERARNIERAIHSTLDAQRITDANNREIFHLTDPQVAAVLGVLSHINGESVNGS